MGGDVDDAKLFFLQLLFKIGHEELAVDKILASQKSLQLLKLLGDIRQRGKSLHGFGHANGQNFHILPIDRPGIGEI